MRDFSTATTSFLLKKIYDVINTLVWWIVDILLAPILFIQVAIHNATDWRNSSNLILVLMALLLMANNFIFPMLALLIVFAITTFEFQVMFALMYGLMIMTLYQYQDTRRITVLLSFVSLGTILWMLLSSTGVQLLPLCLITIMACIPELNASIYQFIFERKHEILDFIFYIPNLCLKLLLQPLRLLNIYNYIICPGALYAFKSEEVIDHKATPNVITFSWPGMLGNTTLNVALFNAVENGYQVFFAHKALINKEGVLDYFRERIKHHLKEQPKRKQIRFKGFSLGGFIMQLVYEHCLKDPALKARFDSASVELTLDRTFNTLTDVLKHHHLPLTASLLQYTPWHRDKPVEFKQASVIRNVSEEDEIIPPDYKRQCDQFNVFAGGHATRFSLNAI